MKKENIILEKTFDFSLNIIEIYKELIYKKRNNHVFKTRY